MTQEASRPAHPLVKFWKPIGAALTVISAINVVEHISDLQSLSQSIKWLLAWWNYGTYLLFDWTSIRFSEEMRNGLILTALAVGAANMWALTEAGMSAHRMAWIFTSGHAEKLFHVEVIYEQSWVPLATFAVLFFGPALLLYLHQPIWLVAIASYPAISAAILGALTSREHKPDLGINDVSLLIRGVLLPGVWAMMMVSLILHAWRYVLFVAGIVVVILLLDAWFGGMDPLLKRLSPLPMPPAIPQETQSALQSGPLGGSMLPAKLLIV